MTLFTLIGRNLWFYRKPFAAVIAGVMVATAVLTGALITGDSVRYSLLRITEVRLGNIRHAVQTSDRFFRQKLAAEISEATHLPVAPALVANAIAINPDKDLRINQVNVIGVDDRFCGLWNQPLRSPGTDSAIISFNIAEKLGLNPGDEVLLRIRKQGKAPSNAPFAAEKEPSASVRVTISQVANAEGMARFSLQNNQAAPFNIFLSLEQLSALLDLRGEANLMVAPESPAHETGSAVFDKALRSDFTHTDIGITIKNLAAKGQLELASDRIFIGDSIALVLGSLPGSKPMLTYLVNALSLGKRSTPYSFVTAMNGPFNGVQPGEREVVINAWLATDLQAAVGDSLMMRYFIMGPSRTLREDSLRFAVRAILPASDLFADRDMMPNFPGMSDAGNCRDWETGAPVDLKKVRKKDEQYWHDFRGTPKAFISLATGIKIWGNRFGNVTAFRVDAGRATIRTVDSLLTRQINPAHHGLQFRPVYAEGSAAARNSTDFGELFLGLSFFIIFSALLLTAMLFGFLARVRSSEAGILSTLGFRKKTALFILGIESLGIAVAGSMAGSILAMLYVSGIIRALNTIWLDAVNTSNLVMHIRCGTLLSGALAGVAIAVGSMVFTGWKNLRNPLALAVKNTGSVLPGNKEKTGQVISAFTAILTLGISGAVLVNSVTGRRIPEGSELLVAGGLAIPGGLAMIWFLLSRTLAQVSLSVPTMPGLIFRNLACRRRETITAIALLALGAFTILVTGANRKIITEPVTTRMSGTGGFLLWAESAIPVGKQLVQWTSPAHAKPPEEALPGHPGIIPLFRVTGDDASCLNLNGVSKPGIMGVPSRLFDSLRAFSFAALDPGVDTDHPWMALQASLPHSVIRGYADQTVITYGLKKSVGDTLTFTDESGRTFFVKLAGGLENSLFQGNILIADTFLHQLYPSVGAPRILLVNGDPALAGSIAARLEEDFRDYGMVAIPADQRLSAFNAVENTYLSVFMLLGGMGVIIGTIGLGIVMLRNIHNRRFEFSLLISLGFCPNTIFRMAFTEYTLVLLSGIFLGLAAAMPVLLPGLLLSPHALPWMAMALITGMVLLNGLVWIYIPARQFKRTNRAVSLASD